MSKLIYKFMTCLVCKVRTKLWIESDCFKSGICGKCFDGAILTDPGELNEPVTKE